MTTEQVADQGSAERARSTAHSTFTLERTYPVPVERVWAAHADPAERAHWFGADEGWTSHERADDFRTGGRSVDAGRWHGGTTSRYEATYTDIVEQYRIVTSYDMWIDDAHLSTSLATTTFEAVDGGTRLTYTEQDVFYDGLDEGTSRETGCAGILDALGAYLTR